mgnify:CR=1 FL=1|tara:strand:- start:5234 stop:7504 length:2271 start_codon:yes stop_codon:yes gene_type:complete
MSLNPYSRDESSFIRKDEHDIGVQGGQPVYLTKDGKIRAKGFVDYNDDLELFVENGQVNSKHKVSDEVDRYLRLESKESFRYTMVMYEELLESFENYSSPIALYENTKPRNPAHRRYKFLSKFTKNRVANLISSDINTPTSFQWHFQKDGLTYVDRPHIKGAWFGPYNYDVYVAPKNYIHQISDLMLIKSGQYYKTPEQAKYYLGFLSFSEGQDGHIYTTAPSLPKHNTGPFENYVSLDNSVKSFKITRSGNVNQRPALASELTSTSGEFVIGQMTNGVFLCDKVDGTSYNNSGVFYEDTLFSRGGDADACFGHVQDNAALKIHNCYFYKSFPKCLTDVETTGHSPIIGFALDGYPIYGPQAYSGSDDSTSLIKNLTPSYRLKSQASRPGVDAPSYTDYPSGYFVEDYEYVNGLGDLDEHNGRSGVTPEYPQGTYAYFATVDRMDNPVYPYVIGPNFYGYVSGVGLDKEITETTQSRIPYLSRERIKSLYNDYPEMAAWYLYSDTNFSTDGLSEERILWVSPHVTNTGQGVFLETGYHQYLTHTGNWDYVNHTGTGLAAFNGNRVNATGNGNFMPRKGVFYYPTSENNNLIGGLAVSGGMNFVYKDLDTETYSQLTSVADIKQTEFYSMYSGHRLVANKVTHVQHWDGKIPAGTPFKIENWSFNGFERGFDGEFQIYPCEPHPMTSGNRTMIATIQTGIGDTQDQAFADAVLKCVKDVRKQNSTLLVNSGIKNEKSKMKSYRKFLERSINVPLIEP